MSDPTVLPSPCVVVLVGPGASGKSTWAASHFSADLIVSSDRLRALVGAGEDDIEASDDALGLLDAVVERRIGRRLSTVIDTLGLDRERRRRWLAAARRAGMPCVAVTFDTSPDECRARNRTRYRPIPAPALSAQLRSCRQTKELVATDGFDAVMAAAPVRIVPPAFVAADAAARRQAASPAGLRFGLHVGSFAFSDGSATPADGLRALVSAAEEAGFSAIYVMDHFRQIPQIGRPWEDFFESYTTLAYLAAATERARLGVLVSGVTYRNPADLGKIIATLDVLSGGRAVCGLGLARVPIILGGGGEGRTLRLAARYADDRHVGELVDRLRPRRADPAKFARSVNAGTVTDHIGRFRELAEAGVKEAMVRLPVPTPAAWG